MANRWLRTGCSYYFFRSTKKGVVGLQTGSSRTGGSFGLRGIVTRPPLATVAMIGKSLSLLSKYEASFVDDMWFDVEWFCSPALLKFLFDCGVPDESLCLLFSLLAFHDDWTEKGFKCTMWHLKNLFSTFTR